MTAESLMPQMVAWLHLSLHTHTNADTQGGRINQMAFKRNTFSLDAAAAPFAQK